MKRGEKIVLVIMAVVVIGTMARNLWVQRSSGEVDPGIPFYTSADDALSHDGMDVYRKHNCKQCHSLWTVKNMQETVPAPRLDGIGAIRDEAWLFAYLSSEHPQEILPSRLLPEWRMPSYAALPESERRTLARYLASLQVKDWYLEETRKAEYEKLTGKPYTHE